MQVYDYLCLFDLECNIPTRMNNISFNEVLELPMIVLNQNTNQIEGEFHTYVRPTLNKKVAGLTVKLTGITKRIAFINKEGKLNPDFKEALGKMHSFMDKLGVFKKKFALCCFSDFDGRHLNVESYHKGIPMKEYYSSWIDIQRI